MGERQAFEDAAENGVYRGNESGRDDKQPRKGGFIQTCKTNGRRGEMSGAGDGTDRGEAPARLYPLVFGSPKEVRHQLGLFLVDVNLFEVLTSALFHLQPCSVLITRLVLIEDGAFGAFPARLACC